MYVPDRSRYHTLLIAHHIAWQDATGQPRDYARAQRETAPRADAWAARRSGSLMPLGVWITHTALTILTAGLWAPVALTHIGLARYSRYQRERHGDPDIRRLYYSLPDPRPYDR